MSNVVTDVVEIELNDSPSELGRLAGQLEAFSERHGLSTGVAHAISLCLEETVTNILSHGLDGTRDPGARRIRVRLERGPAAVTATVVDGGPAFDPTAKPDPAVPETLEDAPIGGRGLRLIHGFSDELRYRRIGGRNHLELEFVTGEDATRASEAGD